MLDTAALAVETDTTGKEAARSDTLTSTKSNASFKDQEHYDYNKKVIDKYDLLNSLPYLLDYASA